MHSTVFWVIGMTRPGIEPWSPGSLANTLPTWQMGRYLGSISGRVIPKTLKMVLDSSLLNNQQYKVRIKGKVEKSRERRSDLTNTSAYKLLKREPSDHPRLHSPIYLLLYIYIYIYIYHVASSAQISLTLSRHPSLSFIASGWSSGLHPVSTQSCCT